MKEELGLFKDQEQTMIKENQQMTSSYESKENAITTDSLKETNQELAAELEELKKNLAEMRASHKPSSDSEKEKKKAEKMANIFSGIDASVSRM
jgi:kinesin family protein 5